MVISIIKLNTKLFLIKRGGGTGPMKPGNQYVSFAYMVPIPAGFS
jgi:hypothetical protein